VRLDPPIPPEQVGDLNNALDQARLADRIIGNVDLSQYLYVLPKSVLLWHNTLRSALWRVTR
jgi:hypothetical protein